MLSENMTPDYLFMVKDLISDLLSPAVYNCRINTCVKDIQNKKNNLNKMTEEEKPNTETPPSEKIQDPYEKYKDFIETFNKYFPFVDKETHRLDVWIGLRVY